MINPLVQNESSPIAASTKAKIKESVILELIQRCKGLEVVYPKSFQARDPASIRLKFTQDILIVILPDTIQMTTLRKQINISCKDVLKDFLNFFKTAPFFQKRTVLSFLQLQGSP